MQDVRKKLADRYTILCGGTRAYDGYGPLYGAK